MSTHALASLTATYTDSEPEGEEDDKLLQDEKDKSETESDASNQLDEVSVGEMEDSMPVPTPSSVAPRLAKLVSYNDEGADDDDDDPEARQAAEESPPSPPPTGEVELPPEPTGRVSPRMQEKVNRLHERKAAGDDLNSLIQNKKEFRNPSIYEKLIQFCGLNELGTNYPPHLYDPLRWGKHSFYEELAKVQKVEMDRLEKERKERTKVEFVTGTKKAMTAQAADDDPKKRKSKWDQVGGLGAYGVPPHLIQASGPQLTSSATGTKSTVLSAFGSLPKKPRL